MTKEELQAVIDWFEDRVARHGYTTGVADRIRKAIAVMLKSVDGIANYSYNKHRRGAKKQSSLDRAKRIAADSYDARLAAGLV